MNIDVNDMVDISVEVEALNLDGIKQNLLDYVEKKAKIDIDDSVEKADKSAQDAENSADEASASATLASDCATQASESLGNYYTKTQTDSLLSAKQNTLTFDSAPTSASTNPVTSGGVYTALSSKANTALSNLSADGQMIVDSVNGTISNCILEIPQNIKCSIAGNVVTLSSGSKLTNTGSTYATTTLSANQTYTVDNSLADGNYLLCSNGAAIQEPIALSVTGSGASNPADGSTYTYFFNTTDKLIYKYADGAWSATSYCYPFAEITVSSGVASFAKDSNGNDMIFNGACFVGHHIAIYPITNGGLAPDGFNADGSMKSVYRSCLALTISEMDNRTYTSFGYGQNNYGSRQRYIEVDRIEDFVATDYSIQYVRSLNRSFLVRASGGVVSSYSENNYLSLGTYVYNGTSVSDFAIRQPVRTATVEMLNKALGDINTLLAAI